MPRDLAVILVNRPGTLADAAKGARPSCVNIEGAGGFPAGAEGMFHVLAR